MKSRAPFIEMQCTGALQPINTLYWFVPCCCLLQANAEDAVRQMLIEFSERQQLPEVGTVVSEDQMDDGTPIRVSCMTLYAGV